MESIFDGDTYRTEGVSKLPPLHYAMLGSRWALYSTFIVDVILRYRREALDGIYDEQRWIHSSQHAFRILERYGARFEISGMDKLKAEEGPYVIVANHMSTLETAVLPGLIRPHFPVTFVVKDRLVKGNIFGPIMRTRSAIPVTRTNPREDLTTVLREGLDRLAKGMSVVIFPQATRTQTFIPSHFNSLGIKLAIKAGVKVIPVALKTDFWGEKGLFRGFGPIDRKRTVHIEFGDAFKPEGRGKADHQRVIAFIKERLEAWGGVVADEAPGAGSEE